MIKVFSVLVSFLFAGFTVFADDLSDKGIGPVKEVKLNASPDPALVKKGEEIFKPKCATCHTLTAKKKVGPGLKDVTKRRSPEWVMNMILNPQEMIEKNPIAQKLLEEHLIPMTFQNLTQDDARAVLELFVSNDAGGGDKKEDKKKK